MWLPLQDKSGQALHPDIAVLLEQDDGFQLDQHLINHPLPTLSPLELEGKVTSKGDRTWSWFESCFKLAELRVLAS